MTAVKRVVIKVKLVRILTALLVALVILLGTACKTGYGTICSLGTREIAFTCPLGFLQMALASRNLLPQVWLSVALVLLLVVFLGRFFCAWVCPAALLRDVFQGNGGSKSKRETRATKGVVAVQPSASYASNPGGPPITLQGGTTPWASYSRYALLGGALLSSFLFGFPVFCLVCPVGLFFGAIFAVSRLFLNQQPSLELLLFPTLLGLELLALKGWCGSICPLGALLSIVSRVNLFVRPMVKWDMCLTAKGANCQVCKKVCPEGIHLLDGEGGPALNDCTKCLACYEKCPARAIKLSTCPLKPRNSL